MTVGISKCVVGNLHRSRKMMEKVQVLAETLMTIFFDVSINESKVVN